MVGTDAVHAAYLSMKSMKIYNRPTLLFFRRTALIFPWGDELRLVATLQAGSALESIFTLIS